MRSFLHLGPSGGKAGRAYMMLLCVRGTQEFFVSCVQVAVIRPRMGLGPVRILGVIACYNSLR